MTGFHGIPSGGHDRLMLNFFYRIKIVEIRAAASKESTTSINRFSFVAHFCAACKAFGTSKFVLFLDNFLGWINTLFTKCQNQIDEKK